MLPLSQNTPRVCAAPKDEMIKQESGALLLFVEKTCSPTDPLQIGLDIPGVRKPLNCAGHGPARPGVVHPWSLCLCV